MVLWVEGGCQVKLVKAAASAFIKTRLHLQAWFLPLQQRWEHIGNRSKGAEGQGAKGHFSLFSSPSPPVMPSRAHFTSSVYIFRSLSCFAIKWFVLEVLPGEHTWNCLALFIVCIRVQSQIVPTVIFKFFLLIRCFVPMVP